MIKKLFTLLAIALMGISAQAEVLFTEVFNGSGSALNGKVTTTGAGVWSANSIVTDNGVLTANAGAAILPFNPEPNHIYTLSMKVNYVGVTAWIALGFTTATVVSTPGGSTTQDRFSNANVPGYAWFNYVNTGISGVYEGSRATGLFPFTNPGFVANRTLSIVLNTSGNGSTFTADFLVDGTSITGGPKTVDIVTVAGINGVGFSLSGSGIAGSTVDDFSLTDVALVPWKPSPANGAAGVNTNVTFAWSNARDPLNTGSPDPRIVSNTLQYIAYDLNSVAPTIPDFQNAAAVTVQLTNSADSARYPATSTVAFGKNQRIFWQVKHRLNTGGTITGSVWQFDTPQPSPMDLVQYWAPVVYQDFQTGMDFGKQLYGAKDALVALNFDSNWTIANNWANSVYQVDQQGTTNAPLKGKVYSSFIESAGFYFIKYGFYHAGQDSGDYLGFKSRHQNDWEVIVLAVRKNGTNYGNLEAMVTQAHTGENLYAAAQLQFSQHRPIVYIEPNGLVVGHGTSAYSSQSPGPDGVVYTPDTFSENVASCTLTSSDNWATAPNFKYKLIPLAEIWGLRKNSTIFSGTKLLQYDPAGEDAGGYLTWDKDYFYNPIDFFKTNFVALAAALASDQYVFHPYSGYDSSQTGPANPMAVFPTSEWLTTVIGGGSGQAWPYRSGCTLYRLDAAGGDDATFAHRLVSGNFELSARVDSVQAIANHKAGLMIRDSLSTNAAFVSLSVSSDQRVHVSYRAVTGGVTVSGPDGPVPSDDRPVWLKLERIAGVFKASYSYDAEPSYIPLLEAATSTNSTLYCGLSAASTASEFWGASSFSDVVFTALGEIPPVLVGLNQTGSTSFNIRFTGTVGTQYILQETASLDQSWADVGAAVTCAPGTNTLSRSSSDPAKFWRVRQYP